MDFAVVAAAAFFVSGLTLFSGFGLGTLLMPVFAMFFPVDVAVAATAVVHGANSVFKILVVGKDADMKIIVRFGVPAIIAALAGAVALGYVAHLGEIGRYSFGPRIAVVTPVKVVMGALMLLFALIEFLPRFRNVKFGREYLFIGGILSGFFGGFSGHQGALRSAFLATVGISPKVFVGTNAAIGLLVDLTRIGAYAVTFSLGGPISGERWPLVLTGIAAAFGGVMFGKRFLHTITMRAVQYLTGALLLGIALALGSGLL